MRRCQSSIAQDKKPQVNVGPKLGIKPMHTESSKQMCSQYYHWYAPPKTSTTTPSPAPTVELVLAVPEIDWLIQACNCINQMPWSLALVMRDTQIWWHSILLLDCALPRSFVIVEKSFSIVWTWLSIWKAQYLSISYHHCWRPWHLVNVHVLTGLYTCMYTSQLISILWE